MMKTEMKRIMMYLMFGLLAALPTAALAIELTDYYDPTYQYQDAELGLEFNMSDGNQDQFSYNGMLNVNYEMEYSTLPLKWDVFLNGKTDFSRGSNDGDHSNKNIIIDGDTTVKNYFGDYEGTFVYGALDLGFRDLEGTHDNDPYAKVSAGLGYGRITNATPLMEAVRCIEDLTKYCIISGTVTDDVYLKLADVISKESEYKSRYSKR
ncbi:MAG: hypothetical protein HQK62_14680, partial [Desulfamplus sp.]|nr:hypothetical protein [Desulfamplus sp.]